MDLLNNSDLSDFTIILPGKTYKLHKLFLARCDYFSALFRTTSKESINNTVTFDQFTPEIFDIFLHILYGITTEITNNTDIIKLLLDLSIYLNFNQLTNSLLPHILKNQELFLFALIKYPEIIDTSNSYHPIAYSFSTYILEHLNDIDSVNTIEKISKFFIHHRLDTIVIAVDKWYQEHGDETIWKVMNQYYYYISGDIIDTIVAYDDQLLSNPVVYDSIRQGCISPSLLASKDKFFIFSDHDKVSMKAVSAIGEEEDNVYVVGNRKFNWSACYNLITFEFLSIPENSKIGLLVMNKMDGSYIIYRSISGKCEFTFTIDAHTDGYDITVYDL